MLNVRETDTMLTIDSDIGALATLLAGAFGAITQRHLAVDLGTRTVRLRTKTLYGHTHETELAFHEIASVAGTTDKDFAHVRVQLANGGEPVQLLLVPRTAEQANKAAEVAQKIATGLGVPCTLDDGFGKLLVWR